MRLPGHASPEVADAVRRIADGEDRQRELEADARRQAAELQNEEWGFRPVVSAYCGLDEAENRYYFHLVKNSGGKCDAFEPGHAPVRACGECRHRVPAGGLERDIGIQRALGNGAIGVGWGQDAANMLRGEAGAYERGIGPRRAAELQSAASGAGILSRKPEYLDWCGRLSDPDRSEFHVCELVNSQKTCALWEQGADSRIDDSDGEGLLRLNNHEGPVAFGGFRFFLDNIALSVFAEDVGNPEPPTQFRIDAMRPGEWVQLALNDADPPFLARRQHGVIEIQRGAVSDGRVATVTPALDKPWQLEAAMFVFYEHPNYDYSLIWDMDRITLIEPLTKRQNHYSFEAIPVGQWIGLHAVDGSILPLRVAKTGSALHVEWLP